MRAIINNKVLNGSILLEFEAIAAYCTVKLFQKYPGVILALLVISCLTWCVVRMLQKRKYKKAPDWWISYKCCKWMQQYMFVVLCVIVLFFGVDSVVSTVISNVKQRAAYENIMVSGAEEIIVRYQGESILEHADLLQELSPERYRELSGQEKADVLGRVAQIEAEYLGIEVPEIQFRVMEISTVGCYSKEENRILLNEIFLPYEESILTGLLHEMYHAYQYACMYRIQDSGELLFLRQVEQWRQEYAEYQSAAADYLPYYLQDVESSARAYAQERLGEYGKLLLLKK